MVITRAQLRSDLGELIFVACRGAVESGGRNPSCSLRLYIHVGKRKHFRANCEHEQTFIRPARGRVHQEDDTRGTFAEAVIILIIRPNGVKVKLVSKTKLYLDPDL